MRKCGYGWVGMGGWVNRRNAGKNDTLADVINN